MCIVHMYTIYNYLHGQYEFVMTDIVIDIVRESGLQCFIVIVLKYSY